MKVAVVTNDEQRVSAHFGRARHYLVYTVEGGHITGRELRDKPSPHHGPNGEHHSDHGSHGHGLGDGAHRRHHEMIAVVQDCDVVVSRGMGYGIYFALEQAGIRPIVTELGDADDAVKACIDGTIVDRIDLLH